MANISLSGKLLPSISLHCDSQAAIGVAKSSSYNDKNRHLRIRHGAVRQLLKNGVIALDIVRSEENMVDPLTKGSSCKQVMKSPRGMG